MSTFRVLACLGALGLILQTPAGQAQSFLGSGPTERFSVPPVGDAMRRPDAPPPATRPAAPPEEVQREPVGRIAPARGGSTHPYGPVSAPHANQYGSRQEGFKSLFGSESKSSDRPSHGSLERLLKPCVNRR